MTGPAPTSLSHAVSRRYTLGKHYKLAAHWYLSMSSDSGRHLRYATVVIVALLLLAVLLPVADALGALGYFHEKTYLLVLQDNSELRNTGGFLACVGSITVENGEPKDLQLFYNGNNSTLARSTNGAVVSVNGPQSFTTFYNTTQVHFWDMNVQYDFATFAPLYASAYYTLTGQHADGVIALDFTALQDFLKTTGPIAVGNDTLTWRDVIDRVHYVSATAEGGSKTDLAAFLKELETSLIATVQAANPVEKLLLLSTFKTLSQQGHVLIYAPGAVPNGYDGAIRTRAGDYVHVVDSNYAGAKADLNVNRTLTYQTHIEDDGTQTSNLTITYQNNNWWDYKVFTTALVPNSAQLLHAQYDSQSLGPLVTQNNGLAAFSSWIVVPPYTTTNVTYTYTLPAMIGSAGVVGHYDLDVQKQAGIDQYTLNTAVTLPSGAQLIHESNIGSGTVANCDVQAEVIYR